MKKRLCFIILLSLMFISFAESQDEGQQELMIRIDANSQNITIDLQKYLGHRLDYYANYSKEKLRIDIDAKEGKANLSILPGWKGIETIRFTVNPALFNKSKKTVEGQEDLSSPGLKETKEDEKGLKKATRISDSEIITLFKGLSVEGGFLGATDYRNGTIKGFEKEEIRFIKTSIKERQLAIELNEEAKLKINISGEHPDIELELKLTKEDQSQVKIIEQKTDNRSIIMYSLISVVCFFIIAYLILRSRKPQRKKLERGNYIKLIKSEAIKQLRTLLKKPGKINDNDFLEILRKFYKRLLGIKYEFTFKELKEEIERSSIDSNTKENMLDFVNRIINVQYTTQKLSRAQLKELIYEAIDAIRAI